MVFILPTKVTLLVVGEVDTFAGSGAEMAFLLTQP
jgi:hypothetical protein